MTDRDIVTELDRWLAVWPSHFWRHNMKVIQRARDEIMALRETVERQTAVLRQGHAEVRDTALEEAALVCERRRDETGPQEAYAVLDVESYTSACGGCAYDIRALALKGTARDE